MTHNMNNKLVVSFRFKLRHRPKQHPSNTVETASLHTSSDTPKTFSRSTVYRSTLKLNDPEKEKSQKEEDRKQWHVCKLNESTSQGNIDERRRKWATQKKIQN